MKKRLGFAFLIVVIMLFITAGTTFAVEGTLGTISDDIGINGDVSPYASVKAQKLNYIDNALFWTWWEDVEAGMDFGFFSGDPNEESRIKDTNCFIVETNTSLNVNFTGTPLTHENDSNITLPTTYWAFTSYGYTQETWPMFGAPPEQLVPFEEIGYFGETDIPKQNLSYNDYPDFVREVLAGLVDSIWPNNSVPNQQNYNGIAGKGIYAFQVFGFSGVGDNISSQKAGQYTGEICLTVAAN